MRYEGIKKKELDGEHLNQRFGQKDEPELHALKSL